MTKGVHAGRPDTGDDLGLPDIGTGDDQLGAARAGRRDRCDDSPADRPRAPVEAELGVEDDVAGYAAPPPVASWRA